MFEVYQENYLEEINFSAPWYEDLHETSRFSQELSRQMERSENSQKRKIQRSDLSSNERAYLPLTHIFKIG